jgi:hypothetical protein
VSGTGIAGTVDTIGQGNFELLTGVRMAGRCKMVSANHTEATKGIIVSRLRLTRGLHYAQDQHDNLARLPRARPRQGGH